MNPRIQALFDDRTSGDADRAYRAFVQLMAEAEAGASWAYEVWDDLVVGLASADNHQRAFSVQLLARLALSDPEQRMLKDFEAVARTMRDERFVTARHTVQSIWRVALAGTAQRDLALDALEAWFHGCVSHKNAALIRTDLITSLGQLAQALSANDSDPAGRAAVQCLADALIAGEAEDKAKKKQLAAWRKAVK